MKLLLAFLSLFALGMASIFEDWHPPVSGDARSPCPALNSLANHGILPRDGRNLTIPLLVEKLGQGLNVSVELATTLAHVGLATSEDPASGAFDLDDLNKHNVVEHDASLSRKDFDLKDEPQVFCSEVFDETLSYYDGAEEVGLKEVAAARWGRIQSSRKHNTKFRYGPVQRFRSYLESSGYHQLLKDPDTGKASVEWIKTFFRQERLPYDEGWRPVNHIDGLSIAEDILQLALLTPEKTFYVE